MKARRGQANSMGYDDNPTKLNQESSAAPPPSAFAVPSVSTTVVSPPDQTLDQPQITQNQHFQQHQASIDASSPDLDPHYNASFPSASHYSKTPPQLQTSLPVTASTGVRYLECLKNHAASTGGHVTDGCGEFMPSGEDGTPEALRCAACNCHRNFHRRDADRDQLRTGTCHYTTTYQLSKASSIFHPTTVRQAQPPLPTEPAAQQQPKHIHGYTHHVLSPAKGPVMMAFGGNSGAQEESSRSSEDLNNLFHPNNAAATQATMQQMYLNSRKRFRTKFTEQQKEKMHDFAERIEWRIQKQDEQQVQQFCDEVGVKRQVFKVWMHNNKQAVKKKQMSDKKS